MNQIGDFGPIYTETDMTQFPVEPFNTLSNLFFLAVIIYWCLQYRKIKDQGFKKFLLWGMPILSIGYIGGTVYHATRSHNIWLIMDFAPIFILAIMVAFYVWKKILSSYWKISCFVAALVIIPRIFLSLFFSNSPYRITLGYVCLSLPVLLPMFIYERGRGWKGRKDLLTALVFLIIAVSFRALDSSHFVQSHIPIGTHWLWHSFGGITTHLVLIYLHRHTLKEVID